MNGAPKPHREKKSDKPEMEPQSGGEPVEQEPKKEEPLPETRPPLAKEVEDSSPFDDMEGPEGAD